MSRFLVTALPLAGLKLVKRNRLGDSRGFLSRLFCSDELAAAGWHKPVMQINHTLTGRRGTIRGMHYQLPPHTEMKLVSCIRGEILDVAVDLRYNSPTFLLAHTEILSAENCCSMLIPEGFAHGFQAQAEDCELIYLHTAAHTQQAEQGLAFDDPRLALNWPIPVTDISERDLNHPLVTKSFRGVNI